MTHQSQYGPATLRAPGDAHGYARRMRVYFSEMFPLPERLATSVLMYVSFYLVVCWLQGAEPAWQVRWLLLGSFAGFLLAMILRLMDELKDEATDRALFPARPLPSGRVKRDDIRLTLIIVCGVFLALHSAAGAAFYSAAALLIYALLMFRYFFLAPRLKSKLLVNLATHNPIVALLLLHFVVLMTQQYDISIRQLHPAVLLVVTMYWALLLAWELARKVRFPEEETEYQTYSRILGPLGAAGLAYSVQTVPLVVGIYLAHSEVLSALGLFWLVAAYLWLTRGYVRFLLRKVSSGTALRTTGELYTAWVMSVAPVEFLFQVMKSHGFV